MPPSICKISQSAPPADLSGVDVGTKYTDIQCACVPAPDPLPTLTVPLTEPGAGCEPVDPPEKSGNIRGYVWEDMDEDGEWGFEITLPATVELYSAGTDGIIGTGDDVLVGSDEADPMYSFEELAPGRYGVVLVPSSLPIGYVVGTSPPSFDVTLNELFDTADFGLVSEP